MVEVAMRFNQEDLGLLARQIPYPGTNLDIYPMRIRNNLGKFLCSSLHKPVRSTPLLVVFIHLELTLPTNDPPTTTIFLSVAAMIFVTCCSSSFQLLNPPTNNQTGNAFFNTPYRMAKYLAPVANGG